MALRKSTVFAMLSVVVVVGLVSSFVISVYASDNTSTLGEHKEELRELILEFRETVIRPAIAEHLGIDVDELADQNLKDIICSLSEDERSALREILRPLRQTFRETILQPMLKEWGVEPPTFEGGVKFRRRCYRRFGRCNQLID